MKHALAILAAAAACSTPSTTPAPAPVPSFEEDVVPVLEARCASARGCHGAQRTAEVDLVLMPPRAYQSLVNAPVESGAVPRVRVMPGDPARSFLLDKLRGSLGPGEGDRMPLDPRSGRPAHPVSRQWIDSVLVRWIEAGAPR